MTSILGKRGNGQGKMKRKNQRQYTCGCKVIARNGKLSIFPTCEDLECPIKKAVKNATISKYRQDRNEPRSASMSLPHSRFKPPGKSYRNMP